MSMLDPTEYDLEERKHLIDSLQFGAGALIVMIGILMMLTFALMPWGLLIFVLGLIWLMIATIVHHTGAEKIHADDAGAGSANQDLRNIEDGGVH